MIDYLMNLLGFDQMEMELDENLEIINSILFLFLLLEINMLIIKIFILILLKI
jgi:hypothetical protein